MDILVLSDSYNQFEYYIQNKSNIKSFMHGQVATVDNDGNYYFYCSMNNVDEMHGRCFDKIIDIRILSNMAVSRLKRFVNIEIEYGGLTFIDGKRNSKSK